MKEDGESPHGCLCFFLGLLFGPIGLIVAAIIGKANGVVSALFGMLVQIIGYAILACIIYGLDKDWFV